MRGVRMIASLSGLALALLYRLAVGFYVRAAEAVMLALFGGRGIGGYQALGLHQAHDRGPADLQIVGNLFGVHILAFLWRLVIG